MIAPETERNRARIAAILDAAEIVYDGLAVVAPGTASARDGRRAPAKPRSTKQPNAAKPNPGPKAADPTKKKRMPQRDQLMQLIIGTVAFWHAPDGDGFATIPINGHNENWAIRSSPFRRWLAARAWAEFGVAPGAQAVEDTLRVCEAIAANDCPEREPWLRVGRRDGKVYVDLADAKWRAIEVSPHAAPIVLECHDLPFVRHRGMLPLPAPEGPL